MAMNVEYSSLVDQGPRALSRLLEMAELQIAGIFDYLGEEVEGNHEFSLENKEVIIRAIRSIQDSFGSLYNNGNIVISSKDVTFQNLNRLIEKVHDVIVRVENWMHRTFYQTFQDHNGLVYWYDMSNDQADQTSTTLGRSLEDDLIAFNRILDRI